MKYESSVKLLLGGFKHEFYFPCHIWNVILPIDELIFVNVVKTTKQLFNMEFTWFHNFTIEKMRISPMLEMGLAENGKTTNNNVVIWIGNMMKTWWMQRGMGQNHISLIYIYIYILTPSWHISYYIRFKYTTAMGHYLFPVSWRLDVTNQQHGPEHFTEKNKSNKQNTFNGLSSLFILSTLTYGCIFHLRQGNIV